MPHSFPSRRASDLVVYNVFVPATPNPTTGFLLFVPHEEVYHLDLTVEEGIKLVISGGIVVPDHTHFEQPPTAAAIAAQVEGQAEAQVEAPVEAQGEAHVEESISSEAEESNATTTQASVQTRRRARSQIRRPHGRGSEWRDEQSK